MNADPNRPKPPVAGLALNEHDALPAGTRFGEFEIIRALGVGGFGIVYLAQDHSLERQVALKEYMPAALAARGAGAMISVRASSFAETYAIGLRSFVNEARLLARFDHPSLVKVYRFWEDNGTAYMVMPYLQGRTLRDARRSLGGPPDEAWIRRVLDPMLDALDLLHREGVFHRDIAPDNILLTPEGVPVLLDFGAARRVISDRTQSLTAILKPSYAPIEQYAEMASMRQGAWTDIYALGAVLHYLLFGLPPAPATARAVQPDAELIEQRVVAGVSPRFLGVVAWMLGVRPLERPQNVATVRAALDGLVPVPAITRHEVTRPVVTPVPAASFDSTGVEPSFAPTRLAPTRSTDGQARLEAAFPATERIPPRGEPPTLTPTSLATAAAPVSTSALAPQAGPAPMRSSPPGMPPPSYVPPPRPPARPTPVLAEATPTVAPSTPVRPRRRAWAITGMAGALAAAALVLWQFANVVGRSHGVQAAPLSAAAAATGVASAALATVPSAHRELTVGQVASVPQWGAGVSGPAVDPVASVVPAPASTVPGLRGSDLAAAPPAAPLEAAAVTPPGQRRSRTLRHPEPTRAERYVAVGPATAREACGDRSFISLAICLDRQCERPRFRDEPQCVRMLEAKRRRSGNY